MQCVLETFGETGQDENKRRSSWPTKLPTAAEPSSGPVSAKTGHRTLDVRGPSVDPSTICQSLNKNGLGGRFAIKKPRNGNSVKRF